MSAHMPEVFNNLVDGQWIESSETIKNINPSDTNDIIGLYAMASSADVDAAVEAAIISQEKWAGLTSQERGDSLDAVANELLIRAEELAYQLSREEGKTLPEAKAEIRKAAHVFRYFAGEGVRLSGEHITSIRPNIQIDVVRRPVGVVGLITPWNFPISIPAWKAAPALAFGNAVILKPSELTCASAWSLAEICHRHLPAGLFQLVMGDGRVGYALSTHAGVNAISFTGSSQTGSKIAEAVHKRDARLQMELGGKNPLIVMEDADLDKSVEIAVAGAFYSTGQRCTASSRLIVDEQVYDIFVEKLLVAMKKLKVGSALDSSSNIGPLVNEAQFNKVVEYIEIGKKEGATLALGGEKLERENPGYYMSPALFVDTKPSYRINQEEIFGPVACVIEVKGIDEAISVANDVPYGLSAGLMTNNLSYASKFRRESASGMSMINLPTVGTDYHVPFGGAKTSGYGPKEMGAAARDFFTVTRTIYAAN